MSELVYQATTEVSFSETDGRIGLTLLRSGDLSQAMTVSYDITAENATPGQDYQGISSTIRFEPGQDRATVFIDILNDNLSEATEAFVLSLVSVDSGGISVPRTCRVNILDDENPDLPPAQPPLVSDYQVVSQSLVGGLEQPINIEFSPFDPDIAYVALKAGQIRAINLETGADLGAFLDIREQVNNYGDRGLLDIALHPDFPAQPYVYAFFVVDPPEAEARGLSDHAGNRYAQLVRFTADASADYLRAVPGSEVVLVGGAGTSLDDINGGGILDFSSSTHAALPSSERYVDPDDPTPPVVIEGIKQDYIKADSLSHAGGAIAFGPDGMLYVSIGDGVSPTYTDPHAVDVQNLNSLSGRILRIDPLTGQGLVDNPFYQAGQSLDANISKVYQYGLRNPFAMAFDPNGQLFITDTGWNSYEEVDTGLAGSNFGWPWFEGREGGTSSQTSGYNTLPDAAAFYAAVADGTIVVRAPYAAFGHAASAPGYQNQVITGSSFVYTGDKYPAEFLNDYFFTDFVAGHVFTIDTVNRLDVSYLYSTPGALAPVHFAQGPDGYVYYINFGSYESGIADGGIGRLQILSEATPLVGVSALPGTVAEGSAVTLTFSLSAAQSEPVTVTYSTVSETAVAGSDFTGVSGATVVIAAGQTSATVTLPILDDTDEEPAETFSVVIDGATLGGEAIDTLGPTRVTIAASDAPTGPENLLVNGSFETANVKVGNYAKFTSILGWTALPGARIELWNAFNGAIASDGVKFAELDHVGALDGFYQDVATEAGQSYTLSFELMARPGTPLSTQDVEVLWNDVLVGTTTPGAAWGTYSIDVTGTGGLDRLTIREVSAQASDGKGALLDDFRLVASGPVEPSVSVSATPATVAEGSAVTLTFSLNAAQSEPVTVTYSTANGTATAGSDFTGASGATVVIAAGQTSATVTLPILDDTDEEPAETFSVVIDGATLGGEAIDTGNPATVTIGSSDAPAPTASVSVSALPGTVAEGSAVTLTFSLSAAQSDPVTVTYSTVSETAVAGSDFTGVSGATVVIAAGQTSATVTLPILDDTDEEPAETFSVVIDGATLGGEAIDTLGPTRVTIAASDAPTGPENLLVNGSFETANVKVGNYAKFTSILGWTALPGARIELWNAFNGAIASDGVKFAELDHVGALDGFYQDVATEAGQSYTLSFELMARPGTPLSTQDVEVLWNDVLVGTTTPGAAWGTYSIDVTGTGGLDRLTIREVSAQASDGKGALLDDFRLVASGPVEPSVSVSATPATVAEGSAVTLTFSLNAAQSEPVTVTYSTANGTATAGSDFTGASGATVVIAAGQTSATVTLPILDDTDEEPAETFSVVIDGATLGGEAIDTGNPATVTIGSSDAPAPTASVSVSALPGTVAEGSAVTLTFSLSAAQSDPVTVTYSTVSETAVAGSDFTGVSGATVVIAAGQTSATVTLPILDDTDEEPAETFSVVIDGATLGGEAIDTLGPTRVTIAASDAPTGPENLLVNGSFETANVKVGNYAKFTSILGWTALPGARIELWNAFNGAIASDGVKFAELDHVGALDGFYQDVATEAGQSYTLSFELMARPGTPLSTQDVEVLWNDVLVGTTTPGAAWGTYSIDVTGTGGLDRLTIREVSAQASDGKGALLDDFRLVASGPVEPSVSVSATPATVAEGSAVTLTFSLNAAQSEPVTVTYSTANGTATAGSDFTGASGATVVIAAGQTSATVTLPIIDDTDEEPVETFSVVIDGATLGGEAIDTGNPATVTIGSSDAPAGSENLLVNGSFEAATVPAGGYAIFESILGWTAIPGSRIELWNGVNGVVTADGSKHAELDHVGALDGFYQDVATEAGRSYTLSFELMARLGTPLSTQTVEVLWNGVLVGTTTPGAAWGTYSVDVTGTGGADRLTIREVSAQASDGLGALLDDFQLVATEALPPPGTLVSFAGETRSKVVDLEQGFWTDAARILPLGDSNTHGHTSTLPQDEWQSYRLDLWNAAESTGLWFDYVGANANGPATMPDRDHQGVSGIKATAVVGLATDIATTHQPDVVLLMLGTNDALNETNAASTVPGELLTIMSNIASVRPDVTILLAALPPIDPTQRPQNLPNADQIRADINAQLPGVVAQAQALGIDAAYVPMPDLTIADLEDGVHPTAAGYAEMAAAWHQALSASLTTANGTYGGERTTIAGVVDVRGSESGDSLRGDGSANLLDGRGGNDRIDGAAGDDILLGGLGDDTLIGGSGDDRLRGGLGKDLLEGGLGDDAFHFAYPTEGGDTIADFSSEAGNNDCFLVEAAGFGAGLMAGGTLLASQFQARADNLAQDADDRFIFRTTDQTLWFDSNGNGSGGLTLLADLQPGAVVVHDDIFLI